MNEEEKKAIERCKELTKESHSCWIGISNQEAIETILKLIKKKDLEITALKMEHENDVKIIDELVKHSN